MLVFDARFTQFSFALSHVREFRWPRLSARTLVISFAPSYCLHAAPVCAFAKVGEVLLLDFY